MTVIFSGMASALIWMGLCWLSDYRNEVNKWAWRHGWPRPRFRAEGGES